VGKYGGDREATDDNMTHTHFMLDTKGYKYTLGMCNTHCFSTATTVAKTNLSVTFLRALPVLL